MRGGLPARPGSRRILAGVCTPVLQTMDAGHALKAPSGLAPKPDLPGRLIEYRPGRAALRLAERGSERVREAFFLVRPEEACDRKPPSV